MAGLKKQRRGGLFVLLAAMSFSLGGCGSSTTSAPPLATSELDDEEKPAANGKVDPRTAVPQPMRKLGGREEAVNVGN